MVNLVSVIFHVERSSIKKVCVWSSFSQINVWKLEVTHREFIGKSFISCTILLQAFLVNLPAGVGVPIYYKNVGKIISCESHLFAHRMKLFHTLTSIFQHSNTLRLFPY